MSSRSPHILTALPLTIAVLLLAGCAPADAPPADAAPDEAAAGEGSAHGAVDGASEVAEPPLALVSIDDEGQVGLLDLVEGTSSRIGGVPAPTSAASDGRYVFAATDDGLTVIDSGLWTWDHVDHFHYYRAQPALVGGVAGEGPVAVSTGPLATAGATGVHFAGSREAVLLDNAALSQGEIHELLRVETGEGGLIAPLGDGAVIGDDGGRLTSLTRDGEVAGSAPCPAPAGSVTTRVGLVIGCEDGAVLVTMRGDEPVFEHIPYPADAAGERAVAFEGRKGRPTVAGVAGGDGFWLLDTRKRAWQLVATPVPLVRAVAADDAAGNVVVLDVEGRVRVIAAESGEQVAVTEPLVKDVDLPGVMLTLDAQRAYLNDPGSGVVHEIAYADGARIARTLEAPTHPAFLAEVGR